jgi:hypothetical protein
MRPRTGVWSGTASFARTAEAAAIASVTAIASIAAVAETAGAWTKTAIAPAAVAWAVTEPAARGRWRSGAVELKLGRHRLSAILCEIEGHTLTFTKRLQSSFRQRGYMYKNIGAAAVRENETKALRLIKPLNSSTFPHNERQSSSNQNLSSSCDSPRGRDLYGHKK